MSKPYAYLLDRTDSWADGFSKLVRHISRDGLNIADGSFHLYWHVPEHLLDSFTRNDPMARTIEFKRTDK